ncbi:hypothetical protein KI440_02285 [Candidatus Saccharibacteria bacterium TM7i]|nr:hypothetical protein KI440_02285 [Candidatus Saccharibacteria bacterium TM7i]
MVLKVKSANVAGDVDVYIARYGEAAIGSIDHFVRIVAASPMNPDEMARLKMDIYNTMNDLHGGRMGSTVVEVLNKVRDIVGARHMGGAYADILAALPPTANSIRRNLHVLGIRLP